MPVTAKLSRHFYERLGDDVANELVEWFNQVDATYRGDLRELNELNFARFDAKLEQRVVQLEAKVDQRMTQLDAKIDQRTAELDAKIDQRTAALDTKIDRRAAELDTKIEQLRTAMAGMKSDLLRWMFLFWATTLAGLVGLSQAR
jgi:ABC-type phosphate transport system auxiliary subunit